MDKLLETRLMRFYLTSCPFLSHTFLQFAGSGDKKYKFLMPFCLNMKINVQENIQQFKLSFILVKIVCEILDTLKSIATATGVKA